MNSLNRTFTRWQRQWMYAVLAMLPDSKYIGVLNELCDDYNNNDYDGADGEMQHRVHRVCVSGKTD